MNAIPAIGTGTVDATIPLLVALAGFATASGSAADSLAAIGATPDTPEATGQAPDLDTGGTTSSPTGWLVSETVATRALVSMTNGGMIVTTTTGRG
jgi:hypothetical protein